MAHRFIIHEREGIFELEERPAKAILRTNVNFETLYDEAIQIAAGAPVLGISHLPKDQRHPKFASFKTTGGEAYDFEDHEE